MRRYIFCIALLLCICSLSIAQDQEKENRFFKMHDKNGDGKIDKNELPDEEAFDILDHNKDGFISKSELTHKAQTSMNKGQPNKRQNKLQMFFQRKDKNGDGKISKDEWDGPSQIFEKLDKNGDGYIERNEIPRKRNRGNRKNFLKKIDADQDGKISKEEWKGPKRIFEKLDTNKDGFIEKSELPKRNRGNKRKK